jgi:hypothetical protein
LAGEKSVMSSEFLSAQDLYWIGYFRADGHITASGQGRFSQSVRGPVAEFAKYAGLEDSRVIQRTDNAEFFGLPKHERTKYVVVCTVIGRKFRDLGVKTGPIQPAWSTSKHFWRGLIDGDGSIIHNSKGHLYLYLCGTEEDVTAFSIFCESVLHFRPRVYASNNIYHCALGGDKVKYLCHLLYKNEYSALEYKRLKAEKAYNLPYSVRSRWKSQ